MPTSMICMSLLMTSVLASELKLATFDGAKATTASWTDKNDPVMGGGSMSTFKQTANKTGFFKGAVVNVSFLHAPGFAQITGLASFADMTGYDSVAMMVKSSTPEYRGFRFAFSAPGIPQKSGGSFGHEANSYKASFKLLGNGWQLVEIPLTEFSYDWSEYTGRCDTKDPRFLFHKGAQHFCCDKSSGHPSKPDVCVDDKFLSKVDQLVVWAEGVEGDFELEIEWIGATKKNLKAAAGALVTFDVSV